MIYKSSGPINLENFNVFTKSLNILWSTSFTPIFFKRTGNKNSCKLPHIFYLFISISIVFPEIPQASTLQEQGNYQLRLSPEETKWLRDNPEVTFTGDPNWLPYEAFTQTGEYIGIVSSHLELISEITGLKFIMSPSKTWTESTQKAKDGIVDILSETDDSDLKSHLNFTSPYLSNPIVIAMGINEHYVENITSIANIRIALIKDYGYASKIKRKYSHINFVTVDNIQDGLISVSTGKVDALLCTLALCSYTINELGISDVKITGKTEFNTKLAFGIQKDKPLLLSILNKAINTIPQGEQQLILDKWIKHDYVEKIDYTPAYIISLIALFLLSVFAYWNRRLTQEINLRQKIEEQLKLSSDTNERFRILFFESPVGHAVNQLSTGKFISVNDSFANITGYTLDELNQLSYWDLTPKRYAKDEEAQLKSINEKGCYGPYEKHYINKDGSFVAVRLNGSLITDPNGEKFILSVVENITDYEKAKDKLRLSSLVLENSSEAMIITNENNQIIAVNPAFTKITGYRFDEIRGENPGRFKSGKHDSNFYNDMWNKINETGQWQGEVWDKRKNGEIYAKWLTINTIKDKNDVITRYVALFSDITERKMSEETIWKQANFDSLTGLPNRNMFHDRLKQEIAKSNRGNLTLALLLIDLDQFKEVNDTLGHDKGDLLLKIAAKRIQECLRATDTVARLGGDEFTIILPELHDNQNADVISQNLITTLAEPYQLEEKIVHISASIGITIFPSDATEIESLIKNADQAMYAAKNMGRNRFSHFTQSLQDIAQNRLHLSNDLRIALSSNQFKVFFQPVVDLSTNTICKAEALLRWSHPERGMVPPNDFISIAEDIGVINEIGDWVCQESKQWKECWSSKFDMDFQISVNMSPVQFKIDREKFGNGWLFSDNNIDPRNKNIIIEITEGLLLNADPEVLDKLHRLKDAGAQVAIDDFGTGYSSLSYLKKFDIDYLKIDQSFIRNLENDSNDLALSEAIIVMAHKLGLKVIAEGVENIEQHEILSSAGCDFAQGFLYAKPIPPEEFEMMLEEQKSIKGISNTQ